MKEMLKKCLQLSQMTLKNLTVWKQKLGGQLAVSGRGICVSTNHHESLVIDLDG